MSNPIRYDSLLVRYLADALRERLAGRPCRALPVRSGEHAVLLPLDRGEALHLDLHPSRGWVRRVRWEDADAARDAEVAGVEAPPDERRLELTLRGGARFRARERRLVVELHTNHWNVLTLDGDGRIVFVLRAREAQGRALRPGEAYVPPAPAPRLTPEDGDARAQWEGVLRNTPPAQRAAAVQRRFAWLGPLNAAPVLGAAAHADDPDERQRAWERWVWLASLPAAEPVLLQTPRGPHPYPLPLPGSPSEPVPDLLAAMSRVADAAPLEEAAPDRTAQRLARAERRLEAARQRIARLAEQLEQAGDPDAERAFGDLLLAHLARVPRGADTVTLPGWDGEPVEIPLDPALGPAENAARFYDDARRRERAAAQLPPLIAAAEAERTRWEGVVAALRGGSLDEAAGRMLDGAADDDGRGGRGEEVRLPFRTFRTSGGLEVRVGRGSADNDRLTFGHSRPGDVWLHARSVPGSHVILRWGSPEHAPPARDLAEAAGLAAWFSKARTSGVVAVDWTRRKHVRKPRGAPPGSVIPQQVKTVFVEPDAALPSRLGVFAEEAGGDGDG